jgi:hypothetical protein
MRATIIKTYIVVSLARVPSYRMQRVLAWIVRTLWPGFRTS